MAPGIAAPIARRSEACLLCERGHEALQGRALYWHPEGYVQVGTGPRKREYVHLYLVHHVLGLPRQSGHVVHHKNGIRHDNRLDNLELVTRALNAQAKRTHPSSGCVGVCAHGERWRADIQIKGRNTYLGTFATKQEAACAYDRAALAVHGRHARVNGALDAAEAGRVLANPAQHVPTAPQAGRRALERIEFVKRARAAPEQVLGPPLRNAEGTPYLPLPDGRRALLCEAGWRKAAMFKWHRTRSGYVEGRVLMADNTWQLMKLHRFLKGCVPHDGRIIDHADGDRLNNALSNLRDSTGTGNARNRTKSPHASSRFLGVTWDKQHGKWRAQIAVGDHNRYLGLFASEAAAAAAYTKAATALEPLEFPQQG